MASRCLGTLARQVRARLISTAALEIPQTFLILRSLDLAINPGSPLNLQNTPVGFRSVSMIRVSSPRFFSSRPTNSSDEEEDDAEDGEGDEEYEEEETDHTLGPKSIVQSGKSEEEKVAEAAEIGYNVIGPLDSSENPFKLYEPYFAVVQVNMEWRLALVFDLMVFFFMQRILKLRIFVAHRLVLISSKSAMEIPFSLKDSNTVRLTIR